MSIQAPTSEAEAAAIVNEALAAKTPLRLQGNGTRSGIGNPIDADTTISSSRLTGITIYEPAEMIIGAKAGTPIADIEDALAAHGQMLTFEPMDHRHLFNTSGEPTLGGVAAGNISGPRRILAGAARDNLVGVRFVNGRGEIIKNGGRVMKNVTGLDLVRLLCGSWGTLGFLTEITLKVLPKPPAAASLVWHGLDDHRGVELLCRAMGTPFEVNGVSHVPGNVPGHPQDNTGTGEPAAPSPETAMTVIRIEGFEEQISYRSRKLAEQCREFGEAEIVSGEPHLRIWRSIRDVTALRAAADDAVWKLSVRPSRAAALVESIRAQRPAHVLYDWSGGLIWLATPQGNPTASSNGDTLLSADPAGCRLIRSRTEAMNGHATLVRAADDVRRAVSAFHPAQARLHEVSQQIKNSFDPDNIFNPGLMQPMTVRAA